MSFLLPGIESVLLLVNLVVLIIFISFNKKNISIILGGIAILQHLLLNWNSILTIVMCIFG